VGFRNYPRFPSDSKTLGRAADALASMLRDGLSQNSYMIVSHEETAWSTTKDA